MNCPLCHSPQTRAEHSFAGGFVVEYHCRTCNLSAGTADRLAEVALRHRIDPDDAAMVEMRIHELLARLQEQPARRPVVMGYLRSYHVLALTAAAAHPTHSERVLAVNAQRLHLLARLDELTAEGGAN